MSAFRQVQGLLQRPTGGREAAGRVMAAGGNSNRLFLIETYWRVIAGIGLERSLALSLRSRAIGWPIVATFAALRA